MRQFFTILIFMAGFYPVYAQSIEELVDICVSQLGDATYIRDFRVELDEARPGGQAPVARYSLVLNRNTQYRLSICNASDSPGRGTIQLYDSRGLIGSNYVASSDTHYPYFDIQIRSTGVYHVFISFKDGEAGKAVGVLSWVKQL